MTAASLISIGYSWLSGDLRNSFEKFMNNRLRSSLDISNRLERQTEIYFDNLFDKCIGKPVREKAKCEKKSLIPTPPTQLFSENLWCLDVTLGEFFRSQILSDRLME